MQLKIKSLKVNIRKRNLMLTFVAIGLSLWAFSFSLTASVSSQLGILVYRGFTSIDTNIVSLVSSCMSVTFLIKSGVSLTYDGRFCAYGCKHWSTNLFKLLVWELTELTTGLAGFLAYEF